MNAYEALVQRVAEQRRTPDLVDTAEAIELGVHAETFQHDVEQLHDEIDNL